MSVTTDGFITNIPALENVLNFGYLLTEFKKMRINISDNDSALELKNKGKGMVS